MENINWFEKAGQIPSLPKIAFDLIDTFKKDNINLDVVVKTLEKDSVLSAKILRLANSPVYAIPDNPILTVRSAMQRLGFNVVRNITLSSAVFSLGKRSPGLDMNKFAKLTFLTAMGCEELTRWYEKNGETGDVLSDGEAFTVGLMVPIGMLLMRTVKTDLVLSLDEKISPFDPRRIPMEKKVFGVSYEDLSQALAIRWNLPEELTVAFCGIKKPAMLTKLALLSALKELSEDENFDDFGLLKKYAQILKIPEDFKFPTQEDMKKKFAGFV